MEDSDGCIGILEVVVLLLFKKGDIVNHRWIGWRNVILGH